jgi:PAS domain S-box-containing protein
LENLQKSFGWDQLFADSATGYMVFGKSGLPDVPGKDPVCLFANKASEQFTGRPLVTGSLHSSVFPNTVQEAGSRENRIFFTDSGKYCSVSSSTLSEGLVLYTIEEKTPETESLLPEYGTRLWKDAEDTMQFGGWIWDPASSQIEWSHGMYHLMGYEKEALKGQILDMKFWSGHVHPDDSTSFQNQLNSIPTFIDNYIIEFRVINALGKEISLYLKGINVPGKYPGSIIAIGTVFDVSVLKNIQGKLETKVDALNKSNTDLEQFAYVASHDLQEPLRKIASFGQRLALRASEHMDEEQQLYLDRILNATRRMQEMVTNLLEFSKIANEAVAYVPTDLNSILRTTLSDLELLIQTKGAKVQYADLPMIDAIPSQVSQLFVNLISNSLKFVKKGAEPRINILCSTVHDQASGGKAMLLLTFEDNGIGFEKESAERIFTLFQRLRGRSEYEGAGIGLSICKKVTEIHHGSIKASGIPDGGARFEVLLPLRQNI